MTTKDVIAMAREAGFAMENSAAIQAAERFATLVRNAALEEAWQAAQPEDSYQDQWFEAKADACRRINRLKEQG